MKTQTETGFDLFAQAKQTVKSKQKKDDRTEVVLSESSYEGISDKLTRLQKLRNDIAELEAELKMLEGEIKQIGKDEFIQLFTKNRQYPGTFRMRGEGGGCMMFMPMDKYLTVDEAKAQLIEKELGEDIVTQEVKYVFNPELLQKYSAALSQIIVQSDEIQRSKRNYRTVVYPVSRYY